MRTVKFVARAFPVAVLFFAGAANAQPCNSDAAFASPPCAMGRFGSDKEGSYEVWLASHTSNDQRLDSETLQEALLVKAQNVSVERAAADEHAADSVTPSTRQPSTATPSSIDTPKVAQNPTIDLNNYIIGEQDSLMITVWKEKELSGPVVVRPDGKITVPLVGEVEVVGMTPLQVQALLADKLKPFVTIPQVTVAVNEIRSRRVYLIGHAAKEGSFNINSSTTVLQIIAQAGGLKDFAKRKKIYVLRQQGGDQVHLPFNYDEVIKGRKKEQNILLQPGDTIVVP